jgi:hypothetical protein
MATPPRQGRPLQTWKSFLRNHLGEITSIDLFVVPTIAFRQLFAFLVLGHRYVDRNRGLRDIDAQFEQLTVDLGSAPERVLKTHPSDQVAHLFADPWSATARTGFPLNSCSWTIANNHIYC